MMYNTPEEVMKAADAQIERGGLHQAWEIASEGLALFPDHEELKKYVYILAPAKVTVVDRGGHPEIGADHEWMKTHRAEYWGKWVAIKNGELLAVGDSYDEVRAHFDVIKNTGILIALMT